VRGDHDLVHLDSLTAPRWAMPLVTGVPAGVLVVFFVLVVTPAPWPAALACGLLVGALIGGAMDATARAQRKLVRTAAGELPVERQIAALKATRGGPIPADPEIRAAALRIADRQLKLVPSKRVMLSIFPPIGGALVVITASTAPGWVTLVFTLPAVLAVVCTVVLIWQAYSSPRRLRERIRLLSAAGRNTIS
jgi:hypothetical protein